MKEEEDGDGKELEDAEVVEADDSTVEKQLQDAAIEEAVNSPKALPAFLQDPATTQQVATAASGSPALSLSTTNAAINVSSLPSPSSSDASSFSINKSSEHVEVAHDDEKTSDNSGGGVGLLSWLGTTSLVSRVVQSTREGMESVITTLDPGMKPYIRSGGNVYLALASENDVTLEAMRDAFQTVYGRATVDAFPNANTNSAVQPVGMSALRQACEQRLKHLRQERLELAGAAAVAVESGLVELLPERWFELSLLLLHDPELEFNGRGATLEVISAATPVPSSAVTWLQEHTKVDYPLRWSGLAHTVADALKADTETAALSDGPTEQWHELLTGVRYFDLVRQAGMMLAGLHKRQWDNSSP